MGLDYHPQLGEGQELEAEQMHGEGTFCRGTQLVHARREGMREVSAPTLVSSSRSSPVREDH